MDEQEEQYIGRFGRSCKVCGLVRYWSSFTHSSTDSTGFDDTCSDCKHTQPQQWYAQKEQKHGNSR